MRKILTALFSVFESIELCSREGVFGGYILEDVDNQTVTLSQYQDKPLYIKMWASWCPICLAGLAEIDDLSAEKNLDLM